MAGRESKTEKDAQLRFFIGSASPDEHLRIRRFKSVEGETRQDLKIPTISGGWLPRALSCSDPAVYRIPVPPFSRSGSVALSHSSHAGISARCRSFAPSWAVCTNPPFSPTAAPCSGNYQLESNPDGHEKTPLAAAIGNWELVDLDIRVLKWWPDCGYTVRTVFGICAPLKPVTFGRKSW